MFSCLAQPLNRASLIKFSRFLAYCLASMLDSICCSLSAKLPELVCLPDKDVWVDKKFIVAECLCLVCCSVLSLFELELLSKKEKEELIHSRCNSNHTQDVKRTESSIRLPWKTQGISLGIFSNTCNKRCFYISSSHAHLKVFHISIYRYVNRFGFLPSGIRREAPCV